MPHSLSKKKLVVIAGPTAVGKTAVGVRLAAHLGTHILSADSRQVYREMAIGTAKPSRDEQHGIPHHLIDEISIAHPITAADFERLAIKKLNALFETHDVAVCVGGTGLYLRAIMDGLDRIPDVPEEISNALEREYSRSGLQSLAAELKRLDPDHGATADLSNPHRVMRALAVCRYTEKPFSSFLGGYSQTRNFISIPICLTMDREKLYERINNRVDMMVEQGLKGEALSLIPHKLSRALQTVGYKEYFEHFDGKYDEARAIELIKQNSRRYAKRQMTWFRNQGNWHMIDIDGPNYFDEILKQISD